METEEQPKRSFIATTFLWTGPAILILLIAEFIMSLKDHFTVSSSIAKAIGSGIVTGAMTIFAFCITDFVGNKTVARVIYAILFIGILYWYVLT
ncbi:MAG: hypothetical protein ABIP78_02375 [Pyrinomonadaceae bacterium]